MVGPSFLLVPSPLDTVDPTADTCDLESLSFAFVVPSLPEGEPCWREPLSRYCGFRRCVRCVAFLVTSFRPEEMSFSAADGSGEEDPPRPGEVILLTSVIGPRMSLSLGGVTLRRYKGTISPSSVIRCITSSCWSPCWFLIGLLWRTGFL